MNQTQNSYKNARDRLVSAVLSLGFSEELARLMARQLGAPKAIDRMTNYVLHVRPHSEEMLVDEMLAICSDVAAWREKKASEAAQASYNAYLFYNRGSYDDDDET
ncbi:MAG: hypothetical protein IJ242_05420 [Clostridia bacterium]|nr:hypothetical protein [Clostridia bacterium]